MNHFRFSLLLLCLVFLSTQTAEARHSTSRIDRSSLDDDIVEKMPAPVLFGVDMATVQPDFGDPRGGGTRSHEGQDMRAPLGTPIVSPTKAIVISTGNGPSAGKYVYTANPGGETFRYMHLDYIADLERGDRLDVGEFIGTVGDTGNAPDGVYHLHFEIRGEDNEPTDPYPRLSDEFTLKEKISFLGDVFRGIKNDDDYAEFLIETFPSEFAEAAREGYDMPRVLEDALEDSGVSDLQAQVRKLREIVDQIPKLLNLTLKEEDQGPAVQLLQLYLLYASEGSARDQLAAAGPTGYYGGITSDAVRSLQDELDVEVTGEYDPDTRQAFLQR